MQRVGSDGNATDGLYGPSSSTFCNLTTCDSRCNITISVTALRFGRLIRCSVRRTGSDVFAASHSPAYSRCC